MYAGFDSPPARHLHYSHSLLYSPLQRSPPRYTLTVHMVICCIRNLEQSSSNSGHTTNQRQKKHPSLDPAIHLTHSLVTLVGSLHFLTAPVELPSLSLCTAIDDPCTTLTSILRVSRYWATKVPINFCLLPLSSSSNEATHFISLPTVLPGMLSSTTAACSVHLEYK